ncbi:MAG: hypothetical protein RIS70_2057, partial [Planctomycetota bacterium]
MAISEAILLSSENKLYGRSQHVAAMLEALDRINRGAGEIILLPGLSGTGKTTLAETLRKPVVAGNGYFLVGKFNQYDRNIPFVAWQQALAQFCDLLLRDDEVQRSQMVADILEAVGSNGQLLLDLVPEFARLIGPQPPLAVISPQEAQHRFAGLVRNVLQAICRPEHPLVLFLDDWQWADAASVRLLDHLQIGSSLRYLLVLAAYRKDEIEFNPSWQEMLQDLQSQSVPITTVGVENLSMEDLRRLVAASVSASPEALDALTVRIHDRTSGNPFFSHALLKLLGEYEFQLQTSSGQERTAAILQHLPDDVVEIYSRRIATLDPITQEVLSLAACLGHRFSLHELAIISNLRLADCEQLLLHFAQDLIVPLTETPDAAGKRPHGKSFFRFAHDRVQQAAYARIAPNDLPGVRLTLARRLIAQLSPDQFSDRVCEIAAHFNAGMELITAIEERLQGVALNVAAARKARSATAFRDALQYHRAASRLLDSQEIQERLWRDLHELGMAICTEQAETEFLEGDIEEAARCIRRAVANALTPLEKAEALSNLVIQYTLRANYAQAIATGREALAALGVILPESDFDTARDVEIAEIKRLVAGRSLDDLLSLPEATDATMRTVAKVLITMGPPCYRSHQQLWSVVVPKVVQLTLQYGHIPQIGYSHTAFAGLLAWVSDDFETGKLFSELANKLMESNLASPSDKSVYHLMVGSSVRHWFNHMALSSQEYDAAFAIGSESGNLQYAAYAFGHNMYCRFFQGAPLETLVRETNSSLAFSRTRRNQWAIDLLEGGLRIFASLTDPVLVTSEGPGAEQAYLHNVVLHQNLQVACIYRVLKVHELILLGDYARARTWSDSAEATISTVGTQGLLPWAEHVFCRLLLLTINSGTATPSAVSDASRGEVAALLKQVQVWSEHNPTNFRHKHLLARAEIERHGNHPWESVSLYDAAIDAALEGGFLQWAAFANERLADFWRSRGSIELAQTYWQQAYLLFDEWGATTKLEAMESAYEKRLEQTTFAPSVDPSGRNQPSATLRSLVSHRFIQQMRQQARMMARARAQSDTAKTAEELAHAAQFLRVNLVERRLEAAKLQQQRDSERVLNDELERRVLERTAELSRAEARFRAVMESAPVAMVMIDREGRIVLLNSELEKLFGYQRDELVGKTVETLVPYRFRLAHTDLRTGFFEHPEARRMGEGRELFGLRKDASEFPVEIGLRPLQADDEPYVLA